MSKLSIEFDPINSFHLQCSFFDYYNQGTTLTPTLSTADIIANVMQNAVSSNSASPTMNRGSTCFTPIRPNLLNWAAWRIST